jgi:hypothetical protein
MKNELTLTVDTNKLQLHCPTSFSPIEGKTRWWARGGEEEKLKRRGETRTRRKPRPGTGRHRSPRIGPYHVQGTPTPGSSQWRGHRRAQEVSPLDTTPFPPPNGPRGSVRPNHSGTAIQIFSKTSITGGDHPPSSAQCNGKSGRESNHTLAELSWGQTGPWPAQIFC